MSTKSLDDSRSVDYRFAQARKVNSMFPASLTAIATCDRVSLGSDREPIQFQTDAGRAERNTGCTGDAAGDVADMLAIICDRQRAGEVPRMSEAEAVPAIRKRLTPSTSLQLVL
jgi:hypothetical protein